jgi:hypothetical protein
MDTLPLELIDTVIDYVPSTSIADLRTLRIVSRTFKTLATPRVFRVLHVTARTQSVQRLKNVHESDELRHFVEKVVFQHGDDRLDRKMKSKYMEAYKFTEKEDHLSGLMDRAIKKKNLPEFQRLNQLRDEQGRSTITVYLDIGH